MKRKIVLGCLIVAGFLLVAPAVHSSEKESQEVKQAEIPAITEKLAPEKGVEIMTHRRWQSSGWAGEINAKSFSLNLTDDFPKFTVGEPKLRHVWVYYLALPIDFNLYPVVALKYIAQNTTNTAIYVIWLDDGTGPDYGGIYLINSNELIPDGKVHILKKDLREYHPKGPITGIALGVMCGDTPPAVFDLAALNFETPPDTPLKESLKDDAPFNFLVVNAKDEPIKGAKVIVDAERANFARSAFTDEKGLCEVTPLKNESGKHMVRVEADGMAPVECLDFEKVGEKPLKIIAHTESEVKQTESANSMTSASAPGEIQEWIAGESGKIFVKFIAPNQQPLPGNKMQVYQSPSGMQGGALKRVGLLAADADGVASLEVPLGKITLMQERRVAIPGWYVPEDYYSLNLTYSEGQWQVDSQQGGPPEAFYCSVSGSGVEKDPLIIKVGVVPAKAVAGFVFDAEGKPVGNCSVYSGFAQQGVKTDSEGKFTFPVLPKDKKIDLFAVSADKKFAGIITVVSESIEPVKITVLPTKDYAGKVVNSDGMPVGKISFYVDPWLDEKDIYSCREEITADKDSSFVLHNAYPGCTYIFGWSGDDGTNRDFDYGSAKVNMSGVTEKNPLTITAKRYIECIMGKVVDKDGKPIKGAVVAVTDWEALPQNDRMANKPNITNEKGEFTIGRLAKGKVGLRITHPDYKGALLSDVPTDSVDVIGVLKPKGTLGVTAAVKDGKGKPISGARVLLFGVDSSKYVSILTGKDMETIKREDKTDRKGLCVIDKLEQGGKNKIQWSLLCDAPDYYPFFCGISGDMDADFEIVLKKKGEVEAMAGKVLDMDGKPIKGAKVKAVYLSSGSYTKGVQPGFYYPAELTTAVTNQEGRFTFSGISRECSAMFKVSADNYAQKSFYSNMGGRETEKEIIVQLGLPCEISGQILYDDTKKPAEGIFVIAQSRTQNDYASCQTDTEGKYQFKNLPAGSYYVRTQPVPPAGKMLGWTPDWISDPLGYDSIGTEPGKPVIGKDFLLKKGIVVSGKVIEEKTGKPLTGSYIQCYAKAMPPAGLYCGGSQTDSEGRYKIRALPGKIYLQTSTGPGNTPQSKEVILEEGKLYNDVDFVVK